MASIDRNTAEQVFGIIDEGIGFFRMKDMGDSARKFYEQRHEDFLKSLEGPIPDNYEFWFQGEYCKSATVRFDSAKGFHIVTDETNRSIQKIIETVNQNLKELRKKLAH